jgi:hypothetical protein
VIDLARLPACVGLYSSEARSGKGTVANVLVSNFGYHELRFSDPIRLMWRRFLDDAGYIGDLHETLEGELKEEKIPCVGLSYREFAEMVGNNMRIINPDVWADIARAKAMWHIGQGQPVVLSDLRYPNEFRMIKELSGLTARIARPGFTRGFSYPSEGRLCKYTFDVEFCGTSVDELSECVVQYFMDYCDGELLQYLTA